MFPRARRWQRTRTWSAVCALVVVMLAGEIPRQSILPWKLLIRSTCNSPPIEESEKDCDEELVVPLRQRVRSRSVSNDPGLAPGCRSHFFLLLSNPAHTLGFVTSPHDLARRERGLPMRC